MKNPFRLRLTWTVLACAAVILIAPVATLAEEPAKPTAPAKEESKEAAKQPEEAQPADKAKADADACKNENTGYFNTLEDFFALRALLPTTEVAAAVAEPAAIEWTETEAAEKTETADADSEKKSD